MFDEDGHHIAKERMRLSRNLDSGTNAAEGTRKYGGKVAKKGRF